MIPGRFQFFSKLYRVLGALLLIFAMGIMGYRTLEGFGWIDALYMTVITVSTVGFSEVQPLSEYGRIFTVFLILSSFGTFAYAISVLTQMVMSGELKSQFKSLRLEKNLQSFKDHVIICGYGRNGHQAARRLAAHKQQFVVIEQTESTTLEVDPKLGLLLIGDATKDEWLEKAGVHRAKALIATMANDADNLFVVVSAKQMNPNLTIISRASDENSDRKLKAAGASHVIMPDKVGGAHMASLVSTPDVVEFLDYISIEGQSAINLEEIKVDAIPEEFRARKIQDLEIRKLTGCNVIGYKTATGEYVINPGAEMELQPNSKLFVLGRSEQIAKLNQLFQLHGRK